MHHCRLAMRKTSLARFKCKTLICLRFYSRKVALKKGCHKKDKGSSDNNHLLRINNRTVSSMSIIGTVERSFPHRLLKSKTKMFGMSRESTRKVRSRLLGSGWHVSRPKIPPISCSYSEYHRNVQQRSLVVIQNSRWSAFYPRGWQRCRRADREKRARRREERAERKASGC